MRPFTICAGFGANPCRFLIFTPLYVDLHQSAQICGNVSKMTNLTAWCWRAWVDNSNIIYTLGYCGWYQFLIFTQFHQFVPFDSIMFKGSMRWFQIYIHQFSQIFVHSFNNFTNFMALYWWVSFHETIPKIYIYAAVL